MKQRPAKQKSESIKDQLKAIKSLLEPKTKVKFEFADGNVLCLSPEELHLRQNPEDKTAFELSARGNVLLTFNFPEMKQ